MKDFAFKNFAVILTAAVVFTSPSVSLGDDQDETWSVSDVKSMTLRADGKYDVVCENGTKEVVTARQISDDEVCGGAAPVPGPEVSAVYSRPEGGFFVLCKNKTWEIATAQMIQHGKVCGLVDDWFNFVSVKPGSFAMGSPDGELDRRKNEGQRTVTLTKGFEIQTTEVTQSVWIKVMKMNPSILKGANRPVENVTWDQVNEFIKNLNDQYPLRGYRYDLPTEAQWEYAARGGNVGSVSDMQTRFFFGNDESKLGGFAWFSGNARETQPVATRAKNALGLYDMAGNVSELVKDAYTATPSTLPTTDPLHSASSNERVIRGGSWRLPVLCQRSAWRGYRTIDREQGYSVGFRLVKVPE